MVEVFKFGGASVKDAEGVKNLSRIIQLNSGSQLLVVVSAMGKTTNLLEELTNAYIKGNNADGIYASIKSYHENILDNLFADKEHPIFNEIANTFVEIDWMIEEDPHDDENFTYDQIVSIGELVSSKIVSAYLNYTGLSAKWLDARNFIHTDNTYREGLVDWTKTCRSINKRLDSLLTDKIAVTQGFIGGTSENYTTTLGREGSDYSAAIFASCLKAKSLTIWKDVPGVLNADPKVFPHTVKFEHLTYNEALEMTYYGATVIHPKTIKPLQNAGIPLYVKPFISPDDSGTIVSGDVESKIQAPTIIVKKLQLLISLATKDVSFITENHLSDIFKKFADLRIKINMLQISAISFSACIDWDEAKLSAVKDLFKDEYDVKYNSDLELLTIRHFNNDRSIFERLTAGRSILLEQLSRNTAQFVLKD